MPTKYCDADLFLIHQGVEIYHAYKNGNYAEPLQYHYSANENDALIFDIRDLPLVEIPEGVEKDSLQHHELIIKNAIEKDLLPMLPSQQALHASWKRGEYRTFDPTALRKAEIVNVDIVIDLTPQTNNEVVDAVDVLQALLTEKMQHFENPYRPGALVDWQLTGKSRKVDIPALVDTDEGDAFNAEWITLRCQLCSEEWQIRKTMLARSDPIYCTSCGAEDSYEEIDND